MEPTAFIVMPTLDSNVAGKLMERAICLAGVPAGGIIVRDFMRRGGVKPSNVAFVAAFQSNAPYISYLNDDLVIDQENWLKSLIEALELHTSYGMAAAGGPCLSLPQRDGRPGMSYGVHVVQNPLAWFCAVIKRQVFDDVGLFDESYIHYADETDFEKRARIKGWKSVYVQHVWVGHTVGHKIQEWWDRDTALYESRWGT